MDRLTVLYMNKPGATFDFGYYVTKHMPMVCRQIGSSVDHYAVAEGLPGPGGVPAEVRATGHIYVSDLAAVAAALDKHGAEIKGDIKNYTNIVPIILTERLHPTAGA